MDQEIKVDFGRKLSHRKDLAEALFEEDIDQLKHGREVEQNGLVRLGYFFNVVRRHLILDEVFLCVEKFEELEGVLLRQGLLKLQDATVLVLFKTFFKSRVEVFGFLAHGYFRGAEDFKHNSDVQHRLLVQDEVVGDIAEAAAELQVHRLGRGGDAQEGVQAGEDVFVDIFVEVAEVDHLRVVGQQHDVVDRREEELRAHHAVFRTGQPRLLYVALPQGHRADEMTNQVCYGFEIRCLADWPIRRKGIIWSESKTTNIIFRRDLCIIPVYWNNLFDFCVGCRLYT